MSIKFTGTLARSPGGRVHHLCCEGPLGEHFTVCGKPLTGMTEWPIALNRHVPVARTCKLCRDARASEL